MAEEEEVIVLEEAQEESPSEEEEAEKAQQEKKRKQQKLLLFGAVGLAVLAVILLIVVIVIKKKKPPATDVNPSKIVQKIRSGEETKPMATPSQIEQMIKKANLLYDRGQKKEALNLFEQIATYSASISNYNLGVAQMREGKYADAIGSFKKAIKNGENITVSAINAAVCSLHLKDRKRFDYFLGLAESSLPESYNSPLYSYLYALVNYYKGNYFEIISALEHPTSPDYHDDLDHLGAIAYELFNRPFRAIDRFERQSSVKNTLILGQLYAQVGEYRLAVKALKKAVEAGFAPYQSRKALALVQLKNDNPQKSADLLKKLRTDFKGKGLDLYPIRTKLAKEVLDLQAAQRRFDATSLTTPPNAYKLLFEFAPYKVFNAHQTLNYIKKGNASIYVDETPDATRYLSRSSSISRVNILLSRAIKEAIDHRLHRANTMLRNALKHYPNHSILHYNLALTYAQLGNYSQAHTHFLRSYHLDTTNHLSAIFALMCESLTGTKIPQIEQFVRDDLAQLAHPTKAERFERALFNYFQGNLAPASQWSASGHENRPVYLVLDLLVNAARGDWDNAMKAARTLRKRMGREILAHLLYLQIRYRDEPIKRFSAHVQRYLKEHELDLDTVYYGSSYARSHYVALRFITGTLYPFKVKTEEKLLTETEEPTGIIESLALADLYLQEFEKAYLLLNQLVDQYNRQDSRTLFLTAVASVGAHHPANATALLQLAKMTDPNNLESRYALGLLYAEQNNWEAAAIQFGKIPNGKFHSKFFDFDIVGFERNGH